MTVVKRVFWLLIDLAFLVEVSAVVLIGGYALMQP